jgi:hypothetical protein
MIYVITDTLIVIVHYNIDLTFSFSLPNACVIQFNVRSDFRRTNDKPNMVLLLSLLLTENTFVMKIM